MRGGNRTPRGLARVGQAQHLTKRSTTAVRKRLQFRPLQAAIAGFRQHRPMTKYRNIDIPDGKDPEDYSYHERRAEILQLIIELGHPDRVSRKQMAERFDVDPAQITRDIQTLREEIHDELSGDAELVTSVIYRRAIREKAEDEEWMEAVELLESWNEWLFETGNQERSADKLEIEGDPGEVYMKLLKQQAGDEEE